MLAILVLSIFFHNYKMNRDAIKIILLLMLFNYYPIGIAGSCYSFLKRFVYVRLNAYMHDIFDYLKLFSDDFNGSRPIAD